MAARITRTLSTFKFGTMMELTKSERSAVRRLAEIAWERELRGEILGIGESIQEMKDAGTSPHDVNEVIHRFHDGPSRDLYSRYSSNSPWSAVCQAYADGVLTDGDIENSSDRIRNRIHQFAQTFGTITAVDPLPNAKNGG